MNSVIQASRKKPQPSSRPLANGAIFFKVPLSSYNTGWSNFCTLVGHFSELFEFAGLSRLKTPIFVPKSEFFKKKKGLHLESVYKIPIFVPKSGCSLKKKKVFNWNRSLKFLFWSQNQGVL